MAGAVLSHTNAHLEGHCLWYISMSSSEIYCRESPEHLHTDNHSCGLAIDCFLVAESALCWTTNPLTKASLQCGFLFLPLALPCYITLLCGVEQLSDLISEGEATSMLYLWWNLPPRQNSTGPNSIVLGRCLVFCYCVIYNKREKNRKASHFAVLYNTVPLHYYLQGRIW